MPEAADQKAQPERTARKRHEGHGQRQGHKGGSRRSRGNSKTLRRSERDQAAQEDVQERERFRTEANKHPSLAEPGTPGAQKANRRPGEAEEA